jgi:polysaccharide pyruvyl transferase WcaK-like protein
MTQLLMDRRTVASSVRDEASRENIIRCLGLTADRVQIAHDPAFCAGDAYNIARAENAARIGLGIMAPLTSYPGTDPRICRLLSSERLQCFWQGIIASLDLAGHSVSLFTNGDEQDQAFAASIHRSLESGLRSRVAIATKPARPEELVRMIAGFRAVLAQRLHSHIIAFSLGVPSVGIIWDSKVEEFAKLTDRRPFFLDPDQLTPAKATAQLAQAIAAGISTPHRLAIQAGVRKSVARLLVDAGLLEPTP